MIIVAAGDSFTWGSELDDCPHCGPGGHSRRTYPALLAGLNRYVCVAYPGNANNAISRTAIDACTTNKDTFLIVTWTFPQRHEFRFDNKWISINSWHTEQPVFSKEYFKHVGDNEYFEVYNTLKEILYLQQYCQSNSIPYMFLTANNHFYQHDQYIRNCDATLENLTNQIDWDSWFFFPKGTLPNETSAPRGFYQWAVENKYNIGAEGHPLASAHWDASQLMKGKFDELVNKHYQQN